MVILRQFLFLPLLFILSGFLLLFFPEDLYTLHTRILSRFLLHIHIGSGLVLIFLLVFLSFRRRKVSFPGLIFFLFFLYLLLSPFLWENGGGVLERVTKGVHYGGGFFLLYFLFFRKPVDFSFPGKIFLFLFPFLFYFVEVPHPPPSFATLKGGDRMVSSPPFPDSTTCSFCHRPEDSIHRTHKKEGCVICHGGDGTTVWKKVAHGETPWIPREGIRKGIFPFSRCSLCHTPLPSTVETLLLRGEKLWKEGGCEGCHAEGDLHAPDLKRYRFAFRLSPLSLTGVTFLKEGSPPLSAFLMEGVSAPETHLTDSFPSWATPAKMPSYSFSREELLSLVLYIESGFPSLMAKTISPERGKELFWSPEKGCATCHSVSQEGGDFGPPLDFLRGKSPEDVKKILKEVGQVSGNFLSFSHGEYFSRLSPEELKILVNYLAGFSP